MNKIILSVRKLLRIGTGHGASNRGFSLVEILVVVLIMGIMVGVVGSLMGGFITNFEITDDQSIARRRAADVFNILQNPMLYAGMGIPADSFDYYFEEIPVEVGGAPIGGPKGASTSTTHWSGPVSVSEPVSVNGDAGSVLRVVYAVPTGVKYESDSGNEIDAFSEGAPDTATGAFPLNRGQGYVTSITNTLKLSESIKSLVDQGEIVEGEYDVRSYVTFPGIRMHPVLVQEVTGSSQSEIRAVGKIPRQMDSDNDIFRRRNVIRPYHDMYLVRAGVAFVDEHSTFYLADITNSDVTTYSSGQGLDGFRVEGIKAIQFVPTIRSANNQVTGVRVYVLAEGDNAITGRSTTSETYNKLRDPNGKWAHVQFNDEVYYEEFQMQWRTRNIEAPGA